MTAHPTYEDKGRIVSLITDGQWHPFNFKIDGIIGNSIKPAPGIYLMQFQLLGTIDATSKPTTNMNIRVQRYPVDPADGGTAWDYALLLNLVTLTWSYTGTAKIEIYADGTYSTSVGIDYRLKAGKVNISQRVIKFLPQI